ncbi:MAG: HlyC/CorC family transporter [Rhodospirillaceae bacterium]|jgi:CBS domain containing-hemolysin-like protein|nr:HlyC/CorC family transporter [Rhodospirillaceae bacterium]MBT5667749.1 HlyC/CorC family transporter [Rhodospirillaceae bacterium]
MSSNAGDAPLTTPPMPAAKPDDKPKHGGVTGWLRGVFGARNGDASLRDTFEELIEEHEDERDSIDPGERTLIENILKLNGLSAEDIMVPRADIVAIEINASLEELLELVNTVAHSRLPVYHHTRDDVIGMVHIKDVLMKIGAKDKFSLRKILRKAMFVAPTMPVMDLLLQMQLSRLHMALVVDEYGGVDGLVTIEDLIEQIVGEIEDEHDVADGPRLEPDSDGTLIANARVSIEEFEAFVGPVMTAEEREEDIDTLAGLVFTIAGRVPNRGELIVHESTGMEFEVLDADPRRIKRIRVRNLPSPHAAQ